jgi:hypothetical protein
LNRSSKMRKIASFLALTAVLLLIAGCNVPIVPVI